MVLASSKGKFEKKKMPRRYEAKTSVISLEMIGKPIISSDRAESTHEQWFSKLRKQKHGKTQLNF